jgi:uncharacterized protein (DUF2141 family)
MQNIYKTKSIILLLAIFAGLCLDINAQSMNITITDIKNDKGNILLSFYTNKDQFPYKPYLNKFISKDVMENGIIKISYDDFELGEYAITLLDDENLDKDMNYRFFIPQEGYGFSNYVHTGLVPPKFSDCCFNIDYEDIEIKIKVQYW